MSEKNNSSDDLKKKDNKEKIVGICNQLALGVHFTTEDFTISKFK